MMRHEFSELRQWFVVAMVISFALSTGCGVEAWKAKTYPVSGSIQINGVVPENAYVYLRPLNQPVDIAESMPFAIVQPDGTFEFMTYDADDGVPPGQYALCIMWKVDNSRPNSPDQLGGRYASVENALTEITIEERANVLDPIELTGEKLVSAPKASKTPGLPEGIALD